LLTVMEAAQRLNVSKYTAYRMIQSGTLPAVRGHGRNRLLVDPDAIDTLLEPVAARDATGDDCRFLTPSEVARILRCGVETVRRLVRMGLLPATRNPGANSHLRIPAQAVDEYLRSQRVSVQAAS